MGLNHQLPPRSGLRFWQLALTFGLLVIVALAPVSTGAQESNSQQVYFDGTGQTLGGVFYDGWLIHGGLEQAGPPVSPAVQQGDRWVQWFEYTRLEARNASLDRVDGEQLQPASIGLGLAESFGLARWHPAFQPPDGDQAPDARRFENGHTIANGFKEFYERHSADARLGMAISREFGLGGTTYQFFERGALSWTAEAGVEFVSLGFVDAAINGNLQLGGARPDGVPTYIGPGSGGNQWIDINLSTYRITAYEGDSVVFSSVIVDGAPETPTATGTFYTFWKLETQTMRGRNTDGSEYIQEDVPWVMYFFADFAVHGSYWRSSFGYSGSHGCVNVPVADAAWLYAWAPLGTRVEVHY